MDALEAEEILDSCNYEELNDWERNFVDDFLARLKQYGSRTYISDKQADVIRKIGEK